MQPLNTPGVKKNFIKLCKTVQEVNPGYRLNIKLHPLDYNSNYILSLVDKYNLNYINIKNCPTEVLLLYFKNILNCISTVAYDYFFLNYNVLSNKNLNLFNIIIGKEIINYCVKMNFDISLTPQYLNGKNIIDDSTLRKGIESIFEAREINKIENNLNIRYRENIAAKKIINFIKERVK